jgi:5-methylcytosine-specific restriction endonuclease McrA
MFERGRASNLASKLLALFVVLVLAGQSGIAEARIKRSAAARAEFVREHPCPATGKPRGACPGWQVDHVIPLKCGGADDQTNMQWLTVKAHKAKTRAQSKSCNHL